MERDHVVHVHVAGVSQVVTVKYPVPPASGDLALLVRLERDRDQTLYDQYFVPYVLAVLVVVLPVLPVVSVLFRHARGDGGDGDNQGGRRCWYRR